MSRRRILIAGFLFLGACIALVYFVGTIRPFAPGAKFSNISLPGTPTRAETVQALPSQGTSLTETPIHDTPLPGAPLSDAPQPGGTQANATVRPLPQPEVTQVSLSLTMTSTALRVAQDAATKPPTVPPVQVSQAEPTSTAIHLPTRPRQRATRAGMTPTRITGPVSPSITPASIPATDAQSVVVTQTTAPVSASAALTDTIVSTTPGATPTALPVTASPGAADATVSIAPTFAATETIVTVTPTATPTASATDVTITHTPTPTVTATAVPITWSATPTATATDVTITPTPSIAVTETALPITPGATATATTEPVTPTAANTATAVPFTPTALPSATVLPVPSSVVAATISATIDLQSVAATHTAESKSPDALATETSVLAEQTLSAIATRAFSTPLPKQPDPARTINQTTNFLLLGVDSRTDDPTWVPNTDVIMVLFLDSANQRAGLVSLPRDLVVAIPGHQAFRINSVYHHGWQKGGVEGGINILKQVLRDDLEIRIDHWALINFDGLSEIIDTLGGIEVNVPCALSDTIDLQPFTIPAGVVQMDYLTAKRYVQSRYTTSDTSRNHRQQRVLWAMAKKALDLNALDRIPALYQKMSENVATDMTLFSLIGLVPAVYQLDLQNHPERLHAGVLEAPAVYPWISTSGAWLYMPNYDVIQQELDTIFQAPQVALNQTTRAECPTVPATPHPTDRPKDTPATETPQAEPTPTAVPTETPIEQATPTETPTEVPTAEATATEAPTREPETVLTPTAEPSEMPTTIETPTERPPETPAS